MYNLTNAHLSRRFSGINRLNNWLKFKSLIFCVHRDAPTQDCQYNVQSLSCAHKPLRDVCGSRSGKIKCESGDEIWRETGERIRAFAYCENCSQPSMFVLCPRESYSNASGSLFVNREPHAQIGFLNRLRPCMTL